MSIDHWSAAIEEERRRRGWSESQLARRAEIDGSQLNRARRGERELRVAQLASILRALGWDLYDLAQAIDRAEGREPADVVRHAGEGGEGDLLPAPPGDPLAALRGLLQERGVEIVIRRRGEGEP